MIDFGASANYCQTVMKQRVRYFSWIIGVLGLLGVLLQSLQVQIEHTHTGGESAHIHSRGKSHPHGHSHSHGHSHTHGHDHSHSHSHGGHTHHSHTHGHSHSADEHARADSELMQSSYRHMHITLLWWEFTVQLPGASAQAVPVVSADRATNADNASTPPGGLRFTAIPWERLISEWVSSWMSVAPPERNHVPARDTCFANLNPAEVLYRRLRDRPPVPPPQQLLSVSFS